MQINLNFMSQQWRLRFATFKELVDCVGQCDPNTNTILIDRTLSEDVRVQTIMHELTHVIEMTMNLNLTEQQVDSLAAGWLHMIRENPELLSIILAADEEEIDNEF